MSIQNHFTHSDGRVFNYTGDVPHTTRDGRDIVLRTWQTTCGVAGCSNVVVVRTATDRPQDWARFEPRRYCDEHAPKTKGGWRKLSPEAKAAQQAGLKRWRESAAHNEAMRNRLGPVERTVLEAAEALLLIEDAPEVGAVLDYTVENGMAHEDTKRDTRRWRAMRALVQLVKKGRVHLVSQGRALRLGPKPKP
jgi:hypothetical protein